MIEMIETNIGFTYVLEIRLINPFTKLAEDNQRIHVHVSKDKLDWDSHKKALDTYS